MSDMPWEKIPMLYLVGKNHKCFEAVIYLPSLYQVQWLGERYFVL